MKYFAQKITKLTSWAPSYPPHGCTHIQAWAGRPQFRPPFAWPITQKGDPRKSEPRGHRGSREFASSGAAHSTQIGGQPPLRSPVSKHPLSCNPPPSPEPEKNTQNYDPMLSRRWPLQTANDLASLGHKEIENHTDRGCRHKPWRHSHIWPPIQA